MLSIVIQFNSSTLQIVIVHDSVAVIVAKWDLISNIFDDTNDNLLYFSRYMSY